MNKTDEAIKKIDSLILNETIKSSESSESSPESEKQKVEPQPEVKQTETTKDASVPHTEKTRDRTGSSNQQFVDVMKEIR